ncbi:extended synaptotagmin-3-like [Rhopilema esculentum]|uniref:extended synaptotagmin-3-like n=1 Tax=Rhopilema esculentum TaxID=499914 RepID=UPI0031D2B74E
MLDKEDESGSIETKKERETYAGFDGQTVKNAVIHHAKIVAAALAIWTIGWLGLHYVWVLIGLMIFALWRLNKKEKEKRMKSLAEVSRNEQNALIQRRDLPSWVDFPDMQRAEWLNEIIAQMWPFVDKMVRQILKEKVEPKIQEKLPSIIKSFYFEKIHLGDQAPRFGGIKVYSKNIERSEIILDCDLIYAGDATVKVKVKGISAGITNIQVRAKVRFEMNPLVSQPPLIGGMSLYLLDIPDINFDLTDLLNLLDVPGLSDILHCCVRQAISSFVVLPNRIKIPIGENVDLESLKYPLPDGILRIEVVEAEDLVAKDTNVFSKDTSDPYVILTVGTQTLKTAAKEETLNPAWNETFEIFVESIHGRKLKLQLFDHDVGSSDESLGQTEIGVEKIAKLGSSDFWLPLEGVKSGRIHLRCHWFNLSSKAAELQKADKDGELATAALFVKLDSAKNLPVTNKEDDTSSPFCTVTVGNQVEASKKLEDTAKPVWEEMFQFLIKDPKMQELNIEVFDWKHDKSIGRLDFPIDRLLKNREMRFKQPFTLTAAKDNSTLNMIVELKALVLSQKQTAGTTGIGKWDSSVKGEIELSIRWDSDSNKLFIKIHRVRDLVHDDDGALETYVRVMFLPDKSEAGVRETKPVKEKDPRFDQEFDFFIGYDEAKARSLQVTVVKLKNGKKEEETTIGEITLGLQDMGILKGEKIWYRLKSIPN